MMHDICLIIGMFLIFSIIGDLVIVFGLIDEGLSTKIKGIAVFEILLIVLMGACVLISVGSGSGLFGV